MKTAYVATAAGNWKMAQHVQGLLRSAGYEITYDWTKDVQDLNFDAPGAADASLDIETSRRKAKADSQGVFNADVFVLVCVPRMFGALIEFGSAVAWQSVVPERRVIVVDPQAVRPCIFWELPGVEQMNMVQFTQLVLLQGALRG